MSDRIHSCYISAAPGTDLDILRRVLRDRGISVATPSTAFPGTPWDAEVTAVLQSVDLVVGVVTNERRAQWVLFELGQARALGKQILLFVPPKSTLAPSDLARFLVVRASIRNREAVTFAIDQLCAAPARTAREDRTITSTRGGLGDRVDNLLPELRAISDAREGFALERFIARVIRESGVEAIAERPTPENGADLAVWADELQSVLGNPLLIEIKADAGSLQDARVALQRLGAAVVASGTAWGLFIYGAGSVDPRRLSSASPPNVLVVSAAELLESMRLRSFAEVVRDLRNRRVHGVYP